MQILEIGAVSRATQRLAGLKPFRHFYLDDIRAPIGKLAHTGWSGSHAGEIKHSEARKGLGSPRKRHFRLSPSSLGPLGRWRDHLQYRARCPDRAPFPPPKA
jgi:hypothetical protein